MPTDKCVVCGGALTYKAKYPFHLKCYKEQTAQRREELATAAALAPAMVRKIEGKKAAKKKTPPAPAEVEKAKTKLRRKLRAEVEKAKTKLRRKLRAAAPPAPAPARAPQPVTVLYDAIDAMDVAELNVLNKLVEQRKRDLLRPPRYLIYRENELVNCGKTGCLKCGGQIAAHGPYWYVYLQDREAGGKLYKTYVGKNPDAWKEKLSKRGIEPFEDETVRFEGHSARYGDL